MYDECTKDAYKQPLTECNKRSTQHSCVNCRCLPVKILYGRVLDVPMNVTIQFELYTVRTWKGYYDGVRLNTGVSLMSQFDKQKDDADRYASDATQCFWFWTVLYTEVQPSGAFLICIPLPRHPRLDSRRRQNTGKMQYKTFRDLANDFSQDALIGSPENNEKSTKKQQQLLNLREMQQKMRYGMHSVRRDVKHAT